MWLSIIEVLCCVLRLSKLIGNLFDEYIEDCFTAAPHNLLIMSMVCKVITISLHMSSILSDNGFQNFVNCKCPIHVHAHINCVV